MLLSTYPGGDQMKYGNKKLIQKLYKEQMRSKREKELNFVEMILMVLVVAALFALKHFFG